MRKKLILCVPIIILYVICFYHIKDIAILMKESYYTAGENIQTAVTSFSTGFNSVLTNSRTWINGYGALQRLLGKHEAKQFEVVRDKNDFLYLQTAKQSESETEGAINDIIRISEKTEEVGGNFLFVQCPYKNFTYEESLKGYGEDFTEYNNDEIVSGLEQADIPILDLRKSNFNWTFYRTDHHWTCESAMEANKEMIDEINLRYNRGLDADYLVRDTGNYQRKTYENSLLGSVGVKVGKYYVGMEDINIYTPMFATSLNYRSYANGELLREREGDFNYTFIDWSVLDDANYYNKYNAFLYGGWNENIIINDNSENDLKCLLISHSYGRPLTQYLSLCFKETRYLDPQKGRFEDNYLEYIEEYTPDIVIVMYDAEINTGRL